VTHAVGALALRCILAYMRFLTDDTGRRMVLPTELAPAERMLFFFFASTRCDETSEYSTCAEAGASEEGAGAPVRPSSSLTTLLGRLHRPIVRGAEGQGSRFALAKATPKRGQHRAQPQQNQQKRGANFWRKFSAPKNMARELRSIMWKVSIVPTTPFSLD